MDIQLSQTQQQKMILSPQMRQYLRLLQVPLAELEQCIQTELSENPMLEENAEDRAAAEEISDNEVQQPESVTANEELRVGESFETFDRIDENFKSQYDEYLPSKPGSNSKDLQKIHDFQESLLTRPEALSDFLMWQVNFLDFTDEDKKIAEEIIGNINEDGYLATTVEDIGGALSVDKERVEKILLAIQHLDPPGIGARTLQEALIRQLEVRTPPCRLAERIVRDHLHLLEKRDWKQLARIIQVDDREIHQAVEIITNLEPKPGRTFYTENPIAVIPDATVSLSKSAPLGLKVEIHDETLPRLRINSYYRHLMRQSNTNQETKKFIREKLQSAYDFIKALHLRKSTLHEITEEIVKIQTEFFKKGFSELVPLRLKDIAEKLNIHESTVSRALQGKYIATPQGTIPYKSFFSTRMETTSGEVESQKSIMQKLKNLIEHENPQKPLSDETIVKKLSEDGIVIARRTVAKYRDLLKILPSHLRRKR